MSFFQFMKIFLVSSDFGLASQNIYKRVHGSAACYDGTNNSARGVVLFSVDILFIATHFLKPILQIKEVLVLTEN